MYRHRGVFELRICLAQTAGCNVKKRFSVSSAMMSDRHSWLCQLILLSQGQWVEAVMCEAWVSLCG